MKVTILLDYLVFWDKENELVLEHIKDNALRHYIHKGKLHVKGTKEELFYMLYVLSQETEIELY